MIKPILFNTEMVNAILDGRKTQTRRLVKPNFRSGEYGFQIITNTHTGEFVRIEYYDEFEDETRWMKPPCEVGDTLWVRETWCNGKIEYGEEADGRNVPYISQCTGDDGIIHKEWAIRNGIELDDVLWRPSIFMPKEAARIFLKVNDVRAERLHEITQQQAIAENIPSRICKVLGFKYKGNEGVEHNQRGIELCIADFAKIWDSTIKPADIDTYGWNANPWVWVIEFERCVMPEGWPNV